MRISVIGVGFVDLVPGAEALVLLTERNEFRDWTLGDLPGP